MGLLRTGMASFLWLMGGLLCFALADWSDWNRSDLPQFPLPAPGRQVKESVYAASTGNYAVWTYVASPLASNEPGTQPDMKCKFRTSLTADSGLATVIESPSLQTAGEYSWGQTVAYATQQFHLPKGHYSISVLNEGCAEPFQGGMAGLFYYHPVTLPGSFLLRVLGYLLMLAGLSTFISKRLAMPRKSSSRELEIEPTIA